MTHITLEHKLIESIQPIRYFSLSICIYHMFDTGLYDAFIEYGASSVSKLAKQIELDEEKLRGFLKYLKNEHIVIEENDIFELSTKGRDLGDFRGWYIMLIGGYAETFLQMGSKLKRDAGWATRDAMKVGVGSCGISHYDAIPLTQRLMSYFPNECNRLLDLGCGNGLYLVEFCNIYPKIQAWGVEPSKGGYEEAVKLVEKNGLQDRITLTCNSAGEFFQSNFDYKPDFIVLGFVLHEILGQEGEEGVIDFLTQITNRFPDINIIVIEVDNQIDNGEVMSHGLANAYYNPYYLLHYFTRQRLETESYWDRLFSRLNLKIHAKERVNHHVDSTDLTIGYLLKLED